MRIHIKTTKNSSAVPFDYQKNLVGCLYKWLEYEEETHSGLSLFSFSWLNNGRAVKNGLSFSNGAYWFISFHDVERLKTIVKNIQQAPDIAFGLTVKEILIQEDKFFDDSATRFLTSSPILIKRTLDNRKTKHYTFDETECPALLLETLTHKMKLAGLEDDTLKIYFDESYSHPKTKVVSYKGIKNKANICPIIIEGKPESKTFAWNVGVGNSTGIGFGALV